jgi:ferrous iron transport protein A
VRLAVKLSDLPRGVPATVQQVEDLRSGDAIARRLRDLGFVRGEPVRVVAHGPIGAEPLLVQVGFTRFALRRAEAQRVVVALGAEVGTDLERSVTAVDPTTRATASEMETA